MKRLVFSFILLSICPLAPAHADEPSAEVREIYEAAADMLYARMLQSYRKIREEGFPPAFAGPMVIAELDRYLGNTQYQPRQIALSRFKQYLHGTKCSKQLVKEP